jgi:hypothetical protein
VGAFRNDDKGKNADAAYMFQRGGDLCLKFLQFRKSMNPLFICSRLLTDAFKIDVCDAKTIIGDHHHHSTDRSLLSDSAYKHQRHHFVRDVQTTTVLNNKVSSEIPISLRYPTIASLWVRTVLEI